MSKLLLTTASLLALAAAGGIAQAQTMPTMFSGPPVNWAGPYVGAEGGYGWGSSSHSDGTGFNSGSFGTSGGSVGGTLGYNWPVYGPYVAGIEGDMSWADMSGSTGAPCSGACGTRLTDLGTVRGRVGYAFGTLMPYVTGGLAFGDLHGDEGGAPGATGAGNTYRIGWAAGAGIEDAFTPHWSAKLEYLHVDLGNGPVFDDALAGGGTTAENVGFQTDMVRAGINYKFW